MVWLVFIKPQGARFGVQISQVFRGYKNQAIENMYNTGFRPAELAGA